MIPFCLIVGDSTGVGTADALARQGFRCEVHARVNAPSAEPLRTLPENASAAVALIALGSNDPNNPVLAENLLAVRRRISADRVTWLVPYNPSAARVVESLALSLGDDLVHLSGQVTRDGLHPANYRQIATSLNWSGIGATRATSASLGWVRPAAPTRQAVVLSFEGAHAR